MQITVSKLDASRREDFFRLHCDANDAGWCHCIAWWVPTWAGWADRSAEENRALRERLFDQGELDIYLLYADGVPAGSAQVGPRDRLPKLAAQFGLEPDPATWAITCFLIAPTHRGQGLARALLAGILDDLRGQEDITRVEAFPKRGDGLDPLDLWNGPEALFRAAGFTVVRDDPVRPVLALAL